MSTARCRGVHAVVSSAKDKASQQAIAEATAVAEAVTLARDLVNTPAGDLPPAELAARAQAAGRKVGLDVEVLDEKALAKAGFGGVLGVGGGSSRPPRLVRLHYKPSDPRPGLPWWARESRSTPAAFQSSRPTTCMR